MQSLVSKKQLWTGRILSAVLVVFLVFDGVTKVIRDPHVLQAKSASFC